MLDRLETELSLDIEESVLADDPLETELTLDDDEFSDEALEKLDEDELTDDVLESLDELLSTTISISPTVLQIRTENWASRWLSVASLGLYAQTTALAALLAAVPRKALQAVPYVSMVRLKRTYPTSFGELSESVLEELDEFSEPAPDSILTKSV